MWAKCKNLCDLIGIKYSLFAIFFLASVVCFSLSFSEITSALSLLVFIKIMSIGGVAFFSIRSVGMIINQIIDYAIDSKNIRTKSRVLPQQHLSIRIAKYIVSACCALFLYLSFCLNTRCMILAWISLLIIILYPYAKRYTYLCHWMLGGIYYLATVMVFTVFQPYISLRQFIAVSLLGLSIALIIAANDIIYAIQDITFDRTEKLFSIPCLLGRNKSIKIAQICLKTSLFCYLIIGFFSNFRIVFYTLSVFICFAYAYTIKRYRLALTGSNGVIMNIFFYGNIVLSASLFMSMLFLCLFNLMSE